MINNSSDKHPQPRIAELRSKVGLTQLALAERIGVTEATIANWETGRSGIAWINHVALLCTALECSLYELLTQNISELRKKVGITQRGLAKAVGVRENTVASWEKKGKDYERIELVARLCEALECSSPDELFSESPKKPKGASGHSPLTPEELIQKFEKARLQTQGKGKSKPDGDGELPPDTVPI